MKRLRCPDCGIPTIENVDVLGLNEDEYRCERCYSLSVFERIQERIDNSEEDTLQRIGNDAQAAIERLVD